MPRKLSAVLDYKLRIRESLRRQIEQAAKKRGVSINREMASRLESSFRQEAERDIDEIRSDLGVVVAQLGETFHSLNRQGDAVRALETLIAALSADERERPSVKKAVAQAEKVLRTVDAEAAAAMRRMHTTGQRVETNETQGRG